MTYQKPPEAMTSKAQPPPQLCAETSSLSWLGRGGAFTVVQTAAIVSSHDHRFLDIASGGGAFVLHLFLH